MLCAAINPTGVWHMTGSAPRKKTLQTKLRFKGGRRHLRHRCRECSLHGDGDRTVSDRVTIVTPSGKNADLEVADMVSGHDDRGAWFRAGIVKDAGDDPDVTHGALIRATVWARAPAQACPFGAARGSAR